MEILTNQLWGHESKANYQAYLMGNSKDIELERKHPAVIICGGGGFARITAREQEPVALYFLNQGYQAIVLNYTTHSIGDGTFPNPVLDLAKMMLIVRENATKWQIDPEKVTIMGFSAGGTVCASLATQWQEPFLAEKLGVSAERLRPNAVVLGYPILDFVYQKEMAAVDKNRDEILKLVNQPKGLFLDKALELGAGKGATIAQLESVSPISHVTSNVPPVFIWGTADDEMMYPTQLLNFASKLSENNLNYELHIFESGPHGQSLANYNSTPSGTEDGISIWAPLALMFLKKHLQYMN